MARKYNKVLVTGSSGFLGSHLVDFLKLQGHQVVLFDKYSSSYKSPNDIEYVGDLLDKKIIEKALSGCSAVFHFAAEADITFSSIHPSKTLETNIIGTSILIETALKKKINRFVFSSSMYVYSDRGSFYKTSKLACENLIQEFQKNYNLKPTILRFGSLYGPRSNSFNLINNIINQAINKNKISINSLGNEIREYIHVYDAVKISIKALSDNFIGKNLIVSGNQKLSIKDLVLMVKEIFDKNISVKFKKSSKEDHYVLSPYKFQTSFAEKITLDQHVDLGQGLIQVIEELTSKKNNQN